MSIVYNRYGVTVHHGDAIEVMRGIPDTSIHAVVTDPPYALSFMAKAWDVFECHAFQAWCEQWARECLRVLKPGGHLLAFGSTRTAHRLTCGIEDAGFEIRDTITWIYGSGFPKSLDVSKAIDKARDDRADILRVTTYLAEHAEKRGITRADVDKHMGTSDMGAWWLSRLPHRCQVPRWEQWLKLRELIGFGDEMNAEVWRLNGRKGTPGEAWEQREKIGEGFRIDRKDSAVPYGGGTAEGFYVITAPATDAARQWQGWGTALKPSAEPVIVARKPLSGTVAATVCEHGTGAINVDACRVAATDKAKFPAGVVSKTEQVFGGGAGRYADRARGEDSNPSGRWPTNTVFVHGEQCGERCQDGCPVAELDAQSGITISSDRPRKNTAAAHNKTSSMGKSSGDWMTGGHADTGGASRFFPVFRYEAKAPTAERPKIHGKAHPTVKPLGLMRWLVRLVTPPGGIVLDPFAGTGTTGHAARAEGFRAVLIERDDDHIPLIVSRLSGYRPPPVPVNDATGETEPVDLLDLIDGGGAA